MIQTLEVIAYRRSLRTTDSVMTPPLYICTVDIFFVSINSDDIFKI